jgi:hypothetical protein
MTHHITWDHSGCEHDEQNPASGEHWCYPTGQITCSDPTGDCRKHCRVTGYTNCEDGWIPCVGECAGYDHPDPGVEHCVNGHILDLGDCNAVLFLEEDTITNGPDDPTPFADGPIDVEWTGYGYQWSYARA